MCERGVIIVRADLLKTAGKEPVDGRVGPMPLIGLIYLQPHFKQTTSRLDCTSNAAAAVTVPIGL